MSKKILAAMAAIVLVASVFVSCGSSPKSAPVKAGKPVIGLEGVEQPDWVNKIPKSAETYFVAGYGKMSNKPNSIMRAEADGKDQIARWVTTNVKTVLTNFVNDSGSAESRQALDFMENISKQVADQSLAGVERDEIWVDAEGGIWVLCSFPKDNIGKSFEQVSTNFARNETAAFAEFKAKEAFAAGGLE